MADYYSPTVVLPDIPADAMTQLERKLLGEMFEHEDDDNAIYFYASHGPNDLVLLDIAEVRAMLEADGAMTSSAADIVRKRLDDAHPDDEELELDMSMIGYEGIFQDIIRRSDDLDHIQVIAAWTCSRMRPDGFGGMATLITADAIESMSTASFLGDALARLDGDPASAA